MKKSLRKKNKSYFEVLSGIYSEAELTKLPKKILMEMADRAYLSGKMDLLPDDESEYDNGELDALAVRANVHSKHYHLGHY